MLRECRRYSPFIIVEKMRKPAEIVAAVAGTSERSRAAHARRGDDRLQTSTTARAFFRSFGSRLRMIGLPSVTNRHSSDNVGTLDTDIPYIVGKSDSNTDRANRRHRGTAVQRSILIP